MPPPTPALALARVSSSSFSASVSGGSASATHSLYYRLPGASTDTLAGTRSGNGAFTAVSGLQDHATYVAWAVGEESGSYSLPHFQWVSLADPEDLLGAVHERWYGDPTLSALVAGGLWTGEVPEGTAYPYAWVEMPESTAHPNFVSQVESSRITFHIWAVGAASASACARSLRARLDWQSISPFASAVCVSCSPRGERLACEGLRDSQARLVFRSTVTYQILVQRPR